MAARKQAVWLLIAAALLFAATAAAQQQDCSSAKFPAGRSFQRCATLPVLGANLHWTYHPTNATADVAFRAPQSADGWVAWGINTNALAMVGSSVFIASQDGSGAVSVLATYLDNSIAPSLANNTLRLSVPVGPAAEYSGGAYTIYARVELPGNNTVQNTVWQAGPLSGGDIAMHPLSASNLQSTMRLDFLSGNSSSTGAPSSNMHRRNLREFRG
nr:unnamed protein product [Digitaria exilis]